MKWAQTAYGYTGGKYYVVKDDDRVFTYQAIIKDMGASRRAWPRSDRVLRPVRDLPDCGSNEWAARRTSGPMGPWKSAGRPTSLRKWKNVKRNA